MEGSDATNWNESDFEQAFAEFDKNKSGEIEKEHMVAFAKKIAGGN